MREKELLVEEVCCVLMPVMIPARRARPLRLSRRQLDVRVSAESRRPRRQQYVHTRHRLSVPAERIAERLSYQSSGANAKTLLRQ